MRTSIALVALATALTVNPAPGDAAGLQDLQAFSDAFAELTARVSPAVVAVKTEQEISGEPLNDIFRNHPFVRPREPDSEIREGLGSGVIVSADGYIITNNHVITSGRERDHVADRILVELADRRSFEARVIGRDPRTDLAVLKIDEMEDLPFLSFTDSDELGVGEWVVAIGNPFGQLHTVTTGIVSAVGRSAHLSDYEDYIQTDAAINPGNSGGALVDTRADLSVSTQPSCPGRGNIRVSVLRSRQIWCRTSCHSSSRMVRSIGVCSVFRLTTSTPTWPKRWDWRGTKALS